MGTAPIKVLRDNHNIIIVTGSEGRAGMAAIADEDNSLDLADLTTALQRSLPPYARPVFLRLLKEVDTTGKTLIRLTSL